MCTREGAFLEDAFLEDACKQDDLLHLHHALDMLAFMQSHRGGKKMRLGWQTTQSVIQFTPYQLGNRLSQSLSRKPACRFHQKLSDTFLVQVSAFTPHFSAAQFISLFSSNG